MLDILDAQSSEPVDVTFPAVIVAQLAIEMFDRPAGSCRFFVRFTFITGFLAALIEVPAWQQRLQPPNAFYVQPDIMNQVFDVLNPVYVFLREQTPTRCGAVRDYQTFGFIFSYRR